MAEKGETEPFETIADFRKAVTAYGRGDFDAALEAIRNCQSVYANPFLYHHSVAFLHYKLATQSRDLDSVRKNLNDAAVSARQAWMLCRNSLFLAHFRASMLYLLLGFNQNYDGVIQECQLALAIEDPKVPDRDLFVFKDSRQKMEVDQMMEELRALIKHCEMQKSWVRVDSKKRYKDCMKDIEERVKEAKNRIKSLSHSPDMKCESVSMENAMANLNKEQDGKSFWSSKVSNKEKENLFKVSIEDLRTYLLSLKDDMVMDLVLEAIDFAKMWETWKFWECFHCCKKLADWESYKKHLASNHDWKIPPFVLSFLPTEVNDFSVEIIVRGEWKPVDTDAAIQILGRTLLLGSFTGDLEWPLCDDSARTKHLETVRGMLQSLLGYECLMQYHLDKVIDLTIHELKEIIPEQLLMTKDLKTLKLVCFLGSSQFENIHQYLQDLSYVFIPSESPEMGNSLDEQLTDDKGFNIKERVVLSEDLSLLLLDGSAVTSANSVHGDGLPHATGVNLSLSSFSAGHVVGRELESWKRKRDSQIKQAQELFQFFEEECSHLGTMSEERLKHLGKLKAVNEVSTSCGVINRREQGLDNKVRTYETSLRELREELLLQFQARNHNIEIASELDVELKFKLDFVSHILEIDQTENAYKFEYRGLSDDSLRKRIDCWGVQLSHDLCVDEATMLQSVGVVRQYGLQLEQVSACEYLSIMLPVLKSFVQATEETKQPMPPEKEVEQADQFLKEEEMRKSSKESRIKDKKQKSTSDNPKFEIGPSVSVNEDAPDVNMLGTGLRNEALDRFLNMIIKSLWHLREFAEKFMKRSNSHQKHINNPCNFCALKEIFEAIFQGKAFAPASLRNALIFHYHEKINSWEGEMDNASAFLPVILESLHDSLISDLKLPNKASLDCFVANCFVHRIFGMDHHERINCVKCKVESMHQKYSSLYLSLSADNLRMKKETYGEKSSDELLKLDMNKGLICKGCGQINDIYHTLRCLPNVFTIVLSWKKHDESAEDISRTLNALSTDLDLSVLFQRCEPDSKYFLVSLVCFSGAQEQYTCFIYQCGLEKYVQYDEKVIGSWKEVTDACIKGCWQPTILFFLRKSCM